MARPDQVFAQAEEALGGPVLALVNNAGVRADNLAIQIDDEDWDAVLNTNLSAAFRLTKRSLKPMLKARYGRIVNLASVVGPRANAGQANYAAAKAGLIGLTKTVSHEVARRGITVTPEAVEKVVFDALPQFGADPSEISREATFEDLDVDSLDLAELSQIIEDEFGVQLKGDDVGKIKTVGDGACTEFEPTEFLSKKEVRRSDRFAQFVMVASDEALREAGWEGEKPYEADRIGCIIGTGI